MTSKHRWLFWLHRHWIIWDLRHSLHMKTSTKQLQSKSGAELELTVRSTGHLSNLTNSLSEINSLSVKVDVLMLSWHSRTNALVIKLKKNHLSNGIGGEEVLYNIYKKVTKRSELGSSQWCMNYWYMITSWTKGCSDWLHGETFSPWG